MHTDAPPEDTNPLTAAPAVTAPANIPVPAPMEAPVEEHAQIDDADDLAFYQ